ncbi:hypothetical protein vseg_009325 [Gypsophila vaccaria]
MSNTSSSTSDSPRSSSSIYDQYDDPLFLSSADQPHLQLTPYLFDGFNFLDWKRDVVMALTAKNKEDFLTNSCVFPSTSVKKCRQWTRCDLMVLRWLLNSLAKPIRANVLYAKSSKDLWSELNERYGQVNALELYQLKKDLNNLSQENSSLVNYYSSLKRSWESIDSLDPIPDCTCGALKLCTCQLLKRLLDRETHSKLIQLLMGLNAGYDPIKTHILSMDQLPSINKALGVLQKIEKQQQLSDVGSDHMVESSAYVSIKHDVSKSSPSAQAFKKSRIDRPESSSTECSHCLRKGHSIEDCFKLKTCDFCHHKGHIKQHCYKFKAYTSKSSKGHSSGSSRRNAHHAGVISPPRDEFSPLDVADHPLHPRANSMLSPDVVQGIVSNVMTQVLQAISEKSTSEALPHHSVNSAGPFR